MYIDLRAQHKKQIKCNKKSMKCIFRYLSISEFDFSNFVVHSIHPNIGAICAKKNFLKIVNQIHGKNPIGGKDHVSFSLKFLISQHLSPIRFLVTYLTSMRSIFTAFVPYFGYDLCRKFVSKSWPFKEIRSVVFILLVSEYFDNADFLTFIPRRNCTL